MRRGRWAYCPAHYEELAQLRAAATTDGALPRREKIGPLEERVRSLIKVAREADTATHNVTVAKIKNDDAREKFKRSVRALAYSEGVGRE
jgi:hypothetical protein